MKRVLFVTWDGPDQNYLESLFFPIFSATRGYTFEVLQFRWGSAERVREIRAAAEERGIVYRHVEIVRRPKALGAVASVAHGAVLLRRLLRRSAIDLILPRSILPAQIVDWVRPRVPVVFDADGLPADERVEFAGWSEHGLFYRAWRDIEAEAVRRAGATLTRTAYAKQVLLGRAGPTVSAERIRVVPNAKDSDVFRPATAEERAALRARLGVPATAPWIVFVGSIGQQYHPRELLGFYKAVAARAPTARLTVLTGQELEMRRLSAELGLKGPRVTVQRVAPNEVPAYLASADLGVAFRDPSFSQRAVSPIKVAEYLLCGLPVLATSGVGDLDKQVPATAGRLLSDLTPASLGEAAEWFLHEVMPRRSSYSCAARDAGLASFSLTECAARYASAFELALAVTSGEASRSR